MAKKSRTPPPPRRPVQAPKARTGKGRSDADDRRRRMILYALGGSGFLGIAAIAVVLAFTGGGGKKTPATTGANGSQILSQDCTLQTYPTLPGLHLTSLNQKPKPKWNSFPPTSGPHYQIPAPWDYYTDPVSQKILLHNLEHGGIVIQYGNKIPQSQIAQIKKLYEDSPNAMVVAPLPSLGKKIVATAWNAPPYTRQKPESKGHGYLLSCTKFDQATFKSFRDEHRGKGPERIPVDAATPGT